ncbi:MAG: hypothetical protein PHG48_07330 [Eubacteriales bacterium]|nr:hypothetical protein [Eubacteriales bacterium]
MKIYVGVTDNNWFQFLKSIQPDEVNFWQPKSNNNFRAINEGELFLFKLHAPYNYIVGGGVFVRQTFLQVSMTWDTFGIKNGTSNKEDFMKLIYKHRNTDRNIDFDPVISSIILSMPFFFEESEWIPVPNSWSQNIMRGKTYDTDTIEGRRLFDVVQNKIRLSTENLQ